jgi:hypothetical protein
MKTIMLTSLSETGEYLDGPNFFKDVWPILGKKFVQTRSSNAS